MSPELIAVSSMFQYSNPGSSGGRYILKSRCPSEQLRHNSRLIRITRTRRAACPSMASIQNSLLPSFRATVPQWRGGGQLQTCLRTRVPSLVTCRPKFLESHDGVEQRWRPFSELSLLRCQSNWRGQQESHEYTPGHTPGLDGGDEDADYSSGPLEVADKGYVIKVSKELMGLFCYIEKKKRTKIQELSNTLRQVAAVALVLTCVRGILGPLVEVFKTTPPSWSKLLLMLVSFDSFAISYLAVKASEPLEQLAALTTENRPDIMEGVEKEEEMILNLATEFIKLFRRLRNIAISITVSQTAQLVFTVMKINDPNFVSNVSKVVGTWMMAPWS